MRPLVFIDLEVNPQNGKVMDFGAVKSNGEVMHTTQKFDFESFIKDELFVGGHNICTHDSKYFYRNRPNIPTIGLLKPA